MYLMKHLNQNKMEAKLIKDKDGSFHLSHVPSGWWIGDTDHEKVKQHKGEQILSKLSYKNCQAIELGYDLDELADEVLKKHNWETFPSAIKVFKEGFQKALSILGDKKFTKEDMGRIMVYGYDKSTENEYLSRIPFDEYIQSLQQTEWDVEIVMECCGKVYSQHCDGTCEHVKPLLDADGCLFLKRK